MIKTEVGQGHILVVSFNQSIYAVTAVYGIGATAAGEGVGFPFAIELICAAATNQGVHTFATVKLYGAGEGRGIHPVTTGSPG